MSVDVNAIRQIGKYPVERFLAEGGMAWVFKVSDPDLFDAPRALKLLKPQAAEGDDYQRFLAEAQILATIQHQNLIHVYDFGQDAETGCHFYTMDYIEGETLTDITPDWLDDDYEAEEAQAGQTPEASAAEAEVDPNVTSFIHIENAPVKKRNTVRDVCEYFCGVLAALSRLHRENVVHRDIKPENIFLTHDGMAVLGDLGIAKARHSSGITEYGRVPGTPLFMAPEHAMGDPCTVRSDVFSLGLSLYAVLSGETIYEQIEEVDAGDSNGVLRYLIGLSTDEAEFEFIFHDSIPDSVCDVIEKACRIKENERYATADEFNEALRAAIDGVSHAGPGGVRPAVAAAIAIPIMVVIGYLGVQVLSAGDKAVATEEAAARTNALGEDTQSLIDNVATLVPGATPELIELVRSDIEKAHGNAAVAKTELDAEDYDVAQQMFVRAQTGYREVCKDLIAGFLERGVPPIVKNARNVRGQVEPAAEQIAPRDWSELETLTSALDSQLSPAGCARAQGLWSLIETADRVVDKSREVGAEMNRRLPEVSAAAVASAEESRGDARTFRTNRTEYKALMEVAGNNLASAIRARNSGDYSSAIGRAKRAKGDFDKAASVRPSADARKTSRKLMLEIESKGVRLGELRAREQAADRSFSEGEYVKSAEAYRALLEDTEQLNAKAANSIAARSDAETARDDAESWAVPNRFLTDGESFYADGKAKLRSGEFASAEQLFRDALIGFQDGKRKAAEEGVIDLKASNADALRLAQDRANQAELDRKQEDERRATERRDAQARQEAAQQELAALKKALQDAKNKPVAPIPAAPTEDAGLRKAMKQYETAYESRSIEDLNRIWSMSRFERLQIERIFEDCDQVRVQVSFIDADINGSTAKVDYDETIQMQECETNRPRTTMLELSASLARRGEDWQIKKISQR
jgi:hypothetical protein